jgi:flagellar capping protein FliD
VSGGPSIVGVTMSAWVGAKRLPEKQRPSDECDACPSDGFVFIVGVAQISHRPRRMDPEHASLRTLQAQRKTLAARAAAYSTLARKLSTLHTTLAIEVVDDTGSVTTALQNVVDAYNDLIEFSEEQNLAASRGDGSSIARDPVLRGLRGVLRKVFSAEYSIRGEYTLVAAIGLAIDRSGRLFFDPAALRNALQDGGSEAAGPIVARELLPGLVSALNEVLGAYIDADGLLDSMQAGLEQQAHLLGHRIAALQDRRVGI